MVVSIIKLRGILGHLSFFLNANCSESTLLRETTSRFTILYFCILCCTHYLLFSAISVSHLVTNFEKSLIYKSIDKIVCRSCLKPHGLPGLQLEQE